MYAASLTQTEHTNDFHFVSSLTLATLIMLTDWQQYHLDKYLTYAASLTQTAHTNDFHFVSSLTLATLTMLTDNKK